MRNLYPQKSEERRHTKNHHKAKRPRRWISDKERAAQRDRNRVLAFEKTVQSMCQGVESLLEPQLCFFARGFHGSPDILERRDGESCLGAHHYVVKEIKSSKKIKRKHVMQAAFYNTMLGEIQGYVPEEFCLLNAQGEDSAYKFEDHKSDIDKIISGVESIKDGQMPPVTYGHGVFPWSNYCDKMAIQCDDLSLISGMDRETNLILKSAGISTVGQLSEMDVASLLNMGLDPESVRRCRTHAIALKTGEAVRTGVTVPVPDTPTTVFLRVEEGMNGEVYMIGALVSTENAQNYFPFVMRNKEGEGEMLEEFLDFMGRLHDYTIYHWGSGGETPLSALMGRHHTAESPEMPMVDLHRITTTMVAFPIYRNKLRSVAEWMGFKWTDSDAEWGKGVLMHRTYMQDTMRQDCLEYIRTYNRDNCTAISTVLHWLSDNGYAHPE